MCQCEPQGCQDALCGAIRTVRTLSRERVGLETRGYLIRVERRLLGMGACTSPFRETTAHAA